LVGFDIYLEDFVRAADISVPFPSVRIERAELPGGSVPFEGEGEVIQSLRVKGV
jgi:hypothetical protein